MEAVVTEIKSPIEVRVNKIAANHDGIRNPILSPIWSELISSAQRLHALGIAMYYIKNPLKVWKAIKQINYLVREYLGGNPISKVAKVHNRYYWDMYGASWPSATFHNHIKSEINRVVPFQKQSPALRNILLAITTHCPLQCEHCYEWDNLNKKEKLTLQDIKTLVTRFQEKGVAQIHFGGGEPMLRFNDIIETLNGIRKESEFWLVTSGYNLTHQKASQLKSAGLTGVSISLDHYQPDLHNKFRNFNDAFYWAEQASINASQAGLVVALSLCATREFINWDNLLKYAEVAKNWGTSFIQLLEPKAVGHYNGKDVALNDEQKSILRKFFNTINTNKTYQSYPIIIYHEPYLQKIGCFGAGNRFLYVDPFADIHACPFCRKSGGNALSDDLEITISKLRSNGCSAYSDAG